MKHSLFATLGVFAVSGALTVSAQTPSSPRPQTPKPSPSTPARTDDKTITVTGCLKAWDASMDAAHSGSSTPSTTLAVTRFVLTDVTDPMGTNRPGAGTGTAGPPSPEAGGHSMGATIDKQYVVTADSGVGLAAHLNHQVRVTGKITGKADHPATGARTPAPAAKPDSTTPEAPRPGDHMAMDKAWSTIAVSLVTMISNTCPGATR